MLSDHFIIYTAVLSIFPLGVFILLICQILADKYGKHKINDKVQRVLLYSVYISALTCACFGYSLHVSKDIPQWCEVFGLPPCFAVLGATKSFLYAFFLRRARKANAYNIKGHKCAMWMFDYIGPVYIVIYWLCYVIITAIFFTGKVTDQENQHVISYCLFDSWRWWFVIFSNTVDVFNCVATLILFTLPLLQSIKRLRINTDNVNQTLPKKFMRTMQWNVVLSFIATISSVSALVSIPVVKEYIWLFCSGDPFINSVCVYMMMASNRTFISDCCFRKCEADSTKSTSQSQMTSQSNMEVRRTMDLIIVHDAMSQVSSVSPPLDTTEVQSPPFSVALSHSNTLPTRAVPSLALHAAQHSY